jgi:DHA1 family tetracycline resistance protein-like MFS transporter
VIRTLLRRAGGARTSFGNVQGNARVIVLTEGIAAVPFQWYNTYLALYMVALGVSKFEVGLLTSALMATQLVSNLLGGYFADRFGRKRVLVVGDIICWGIPMLLYAIARNPWYFLVGRLINGFVYIVLTSFDCLFVEDVPGEHRPAVFSMMQFLVAAASLLAPVAGIMVARWGIVPAGRAIMLSTMVSLVGIAIVRQFTLRETTMGRERMSAVQTMDPRALVREYAAAVGTVAKNSLVRTFLAVRITQAFIGVMWGTYAALYLADPQGVALPQAVISLLPFVSAVVTIGLIALAAGRVSSPHDFGNLVTGEVLWLAAGLVFLASPAGTIWFAVLYTALAAIGAMFFQPASQSFWANIVGDRERALVFSTAGTLIILCALPAGPLAGALYTWEPRAPFVASIALQALSLGLILFLRPGARAERQSSTP